MSERLTLKSMIAVAIQKELPVPDEASGLVEYHSYGVIDNEYIDKRAGTVPSDRHMEIINSLSRDPQEREDWEVYTGMDPVGDPQEVDSHGDVFDKAALRDMQKGALGSPVLTDHNHEMGANPPMGICIEASITKEGRLKETWAFPKEDYNAGIRMGLSKGLIRNISVGIFVSPRDKICNSCGDRSIYSMECPHYPGDKDNTSVTIKRVKRYAERSLVNIPARLGTSTKSLAPDSFPSKEDIDKVIQEVTEQTDKKLYSRGKVTKRLTEQDPPMVFDLLFNYDEVFLQILVPEGKDLTGANSLGLQNYVTDKPGRCFKVSDSILAQSHLIKDGDKTFVVIDHRLFPDNESVNEGNFVLTVYCTMKEPSTKEDSASAATIPSVINEDEVVTEKANVEAPEAQEPSEKQEDAAPEAPASEETSAPEQEEIKSVEVPVVKELAVEELTKSFKSEVEPITKALAEATEKFSQLAEMQAKTDKALVELTENVTKLAEQVVRLADFSSEEAINQILEVVGQLKEQKAEVPTQVAHKSLESFVDTLRVKK